MRSSQTKKAFGLIEVLIAIAISGVVMLGAVSLSAEATKKLKQDEIADLASSVLIRSLEITRSPLACDNLGPLMTGSTDQFFTLNSDSLVTKVCNGQSTQEPYGLIAATDNIGTISTCTGGGSYAVKSLANVNICNQIEVEACGSNPGSNDIRIKCPTNAATDKTHITYAIISNVVYNIYGKDYYTNLISYRTELAP